MLFIILIVTIVTSRKYIQKNIYNILSFIFILLLLFLRAEKSDSREEKASRIVEGKVTHLQLNIGLKTVFFFASLMENKFNRVLGVKYL